MAADGREDLGIVHAPTGLRQNGGGDPVPDGGRARRGIFCYYSIVGKNLQQFRPGQFLGAVVQIGRHSRFFGVCAPALRQPDCHFFYIFGVRPASGAQARFDQTFGFLCCHGASSLPGCGAFAGR